MEKAGTGGVRKRRHARESDQIPRRMGARGVAERETRVGSLLARAREASGIALTCSSPSGGAPLFPATGAMVALSRSPDSASPRPDATADLSFARFDRAPVRLGFVCAVRC
jgi:hypothetical protein